MSHAAEERIGAMTLCEEERLALFALSEDARIYQKTVRRLYDLTGSYLEALFQPPEGYRAAGIRLDEASAEALRKAAAGFDTAFSRYRALTDSGVRLLSRHDPDYPRRLMLLSDPPEYLYVKGRLPSEEGRTAGMIGARQCSEYGSSAARFFAGELSRAGVGIVSGMALGIDGAAGRGALTGTGGSFAVLGCGINICYPKENYDLYEAVANGGGGVISELSPSAPPLGFHFVARNRIIAGLSDVLLVLEAREKSGTFTTVDFALEQGKDIFVLPGRITDPLGRGCNRLLKEGALPLISPADVLEYFRIGQEGTKTVMEEEDLSSLTPNQSAVYGCMSYDSLHVEEIAEKCGLSLALTLNILFELEHMGYITSSGSAYYRKLVHGAH